METEWICQDARREAQTPLSAMVVRLTLVEDHIGPWIPPLTKAQFSEIETRFWKVDDASQPWLCPERLVSTSDGGYVA